MAMTQDIYEISGTKNYPIGMRIARDERVFRYARIAEVASLIGRAVANKNTDEENALAAATSAIGSTTVLITVQAAAGLVANELKGGYLTYPWFYCHRIRSHPAALSGATCLLQLETAIHGTEITGATRVFAFHNPWYGVGYEVATSHCASYVGWPFDSIAIGQYTWVQTWGPVNPVTGAFFGAPGERQAWFAADGGITTFANPATDMDQSYQHAGFWIPNTWYGGASHAMQDGGHLLFLQICP